MGSCVGLGAGEAPLVCPRPWSCRLILRALLRVLDFAATSADHVLCVCLFPGASRWWGRRGGPSARPGSVPRQPLTHRDMLSLAVIALIYNFISGYRNKC